MTRRASTQFLLALVVAACLGAGARAAVAASTGKGLSDPGDLKSLNVEQATGGTPILLRGGDARQQLCVTGVYSTGQSRDLTRAVRYSADPTGIVDIDAKGLVVPLRDGEAHIRVSGPGHTSAEFPVKVERFAHPLPINFKNQIVPIFTKLGCNSGGCHGKASGQNGFKLSLLGFYPEDDYEFLVKESRGRRLFPTSPGESLLLLKPSGRYPHGGGKRMDVGSYEYRMLYRWIEQGTALRQRHRSDGRQNRVPARRPRDGAGLSAADHRHCSLQRRHDRRCHADVPVRAQRHRDGRGQLDRIGEDARSGRTGRHHGPVSGAGRHVSFDDSPRRIRRLAAARTESGRQGRLRQAEGAGHSAVGLVRRCDLPAAGVDRHRRHHADRKRGHRVSGESRSREARQTD